MFGRLQHFYVLIFSALFFTTLFFITNLPARAGPPHIKVFGRDSVSVVGSPPSSMGHVPPPTHAHGDSLVKLTPGPRLPVRVMGGRPAWKGELPWQAAILHTGYSEGDNYNAFFCGGVLISIGREHDSRWVLTAAHCVEDYQTDSLAHQLKVVVGDLSLTQPTQQSVGVSRVIVHYDRDKLANDIALLELDEAVRGNAGIELITEPREELLLHRGRALTVSGWGWRSTHGPISEDLICAVVRLLDRVDCNDPSAHHGEVTECMMCAGNSPNVDACWGDSGGPLVDRQEKRLVGIVSWGDTCGDPHKPGVYTRVACYVNWIADTTAAYARPHPESAPHGVSVLH